MINITKINNLIKIEYQNPILYIPTSMLNYKIEDDIIFIEKINNVKLSTEFENCTINGTVLTKENADNLLTNLIK